MWKNIKHVYIDNQPTVTSSDSSNNALFILSVNINGFTRQCKCIGVNGTKRLSVFINDGYTASVLVLF